MTIIVFLTNKFDHNYEKKERQSKKLVFVYQWVFIGS